MSELATDEPLIKQDETGKVTHIRGVSLPEDLLHTYALESLSLRAPAKDTTWVVRGAYKFARRIQGKGEKETKD